MKWNADIHVKKSERVLFSGMYHPNGGSLSGFNVVRWRLKVYLANDLLQSFVIKLKGE